MAEITNEDLARMMQEGFHSVDTRFEKVEGKIDMVHNTLLNHMDASATHTGSIEQRLAVVEEKLGIKQESV